MIETVYIELPFEKITYLDRPEFHKEEKEFKKSVDAINGNLWNERSCLLLV